jgi:hypothetical protein
VTNVKLTAEVKAVAGILAFLVAAIGLAVGAVALTRPSVRWVLVASLIGCGTFFLGLHAYELREALKRTPIPRGVSLLKGLRQALAAYNPKGGWMVRHRWIRAGVLIILWLGTSLAVVGRRASGH